MKNIFKKSIIATAMMIGSLTFSFAEDVAKAPTLEIPDPVAVIKGKTLSKVEFMEFVDFLTNGNPNMLQNAQQVDSLVEAYAIQTELANRAVSVKLDKTPSFENRIKQIKVATLAELFIADYTEKMKVTDEELKQEYDRQVASIEKEEYKAAHILVENEEEAKKIIKELAEGKVFADIAKEVSTDTGSAENGGDLGWFSVGMMVPEFSDAVKTMKPGEVSKEPVKSQFGYHVIFLEEARPVAVDSFESLKDGLKNILSDQKLRKYLEDVGTELKIEYKMPSADKKSEAAK